MIEWPGISGHILPTPHVSRGALQTRWTKRNKPIEPLLICLYFYMYMVVLFLLHNAAFVSDCDAVECHFAEINLLTAQVRMQHLFHVYHEIYSQRVKLIDTFSL